MKYNFNQPVLGLDDLPVMQDRTLDEAGNVVPAPVMIGKTIAGALIQQTDGDALKMWDWAKTLHNGKPLDLDRSDQEKFKAFLNKPGQFTAILRAQALEVMIEAENAEKVAPKKGK